MELIDAAYNGDEAKVKQLLEAGADVNTVNESGYTALHWATCQGHMKVVEVLLERGADVDKGTQDGRTALHFSVQQQQQTAYGAAADAAAVKDQADDVLVNLLLSKQAEVNVKNCTGRTALHLAAAGGSTAQISALLDAGADIEAKDIDGMTPLLVACGEGQRDVVKLLLSRGAHVDAKDEDNRTALQITASRNDGEVMALLMEAGTDTSAKDQDGGSVLHLASKGGHVELVKELLDKGAGVNEKDEDHKTPLHVAAEFGRELVIPVLLAAGADVDAVDDDGCTPLHLAAAAEMSAAVMALLKGKSRIGATDLVGRTPLHSAAAAGHPAVFYVLFTYGAPINAKDEDGCTALHLTIAAGDVESAKKLLQLGADVNALDDDGCTALHLAVLKGHTGLVEVLLGTKKADVNLKDKVGRSAASLAIAQGSTQLVKLLTDAGAVLDETKGELELHEQQKEVEELQLLMAKCGPVGEDMTPPPLVSVATRRLGAESNYLHKAAKRGDVKSVGLVINRFPIHSRDYKGRTALHLAADNGCKEVVKFLLCKCDEYDFVNARADDHRTALEMANDQGYMEVASILRSCGAVLPGHSRSGGSGFFASLFGSTSHGPSYDSNNHYEDEDDNSRSSSSKPRLARNAGRSHVRSGMTKPDSQVSWATGSSPGHGGTRFGGRAMNFKGPATPIPPSFGADMLSDTSGRYREPMFDGDYVKISSLNPDEQTWILKVNRMARKVDGLAAFVDNDNRFADPEMCIKDTYAALHGLFINPDSREVMPQSLYEMLKPMCKTFEKMQKVVAKKWVEPEVKYKVFVYVFPILETVLRMGQAMLDLRYGRGGWFSTPEATCMDTLQGCETEFRQRVKTMQRSNTFQKLL